MALVCLNFDRGVAHEMNVKSIIYRNCFDAMCFWYCICKIWIIYAKIQFVGWGFNNHISSGIYPNCWTLLDNHHQNFTPASQTQTQQPKPSPQPSPQPSASPAELMCVGGKCFSETQGMPCFAVYVAGGGRDQFPWLVGWLGTPRSIQECANPRFSQASILMWFGTWIV